MGQIPFWSAMIAAIAVENTVFARALGMTRPVLYLKSAKTGMLYGAVFTWTVIVSSALASLVNWLLLDASFARYVRPLAFLLCVGIVYVMTTFVSGTYLPKLFRKIRRILPLTTFNTALFGALYMSIQQDFVNSIGYALGTGVGYTAAILILYYAQKCLAASPVPRSFRGMPVLLVYIGLLSLALYGLIGHALPT